MPCPSEWWWIIGEQHALHHIDDDYGDDDGFSDEVDVNHDDDDGDEDYAKNIDTMIVAIMHRGRSTISQHND